MSDQDFQKQVLEDLGFIKGKMEGIGIEQEDNKKAHIAMHDQINEQGKEIARLQVKAGIWGVVGGIISGALASLGLR